MFLSYSTKRYLDQKELAMNANQNNKQGPKVNDKETSWDRA